MKIVWTERVRKNEYTPCNYFYPYCWDPHNVIRNKRKQQELRQFGFRNPGIPESFTRKIRNPMFWNQEFSSRTRNPESSTWNSESTEWNPETKTILDYLRWGNQSSVVMPLLFRNIARLHSRRLRLCNLTGKRKVFINKKGSTPTRHQPSSAGKNGVCWLLSQPV